MSDRSSFGFASDKDPGSSAGPGNEGKEAGERRCERKGSSVDIDDPKGGQSIKGRGKGIELDQLRVRMTIYNMRESMTNGEIALSSCSLLLVGAVSTVVFVPFRQTEQVAQRRSPRTMVALTKELSIST
jgi:hypothetical protein